MNAELSCMAMGLDFVIGFCYCYFKDIYLVVLTISNLLPSILPESLCLHAQLVFRN